MTFDAKFSARQNTKEYQREWLINIDNSGTVTDVCVWDRKRFSFTKTPTTPFDLSQCLFDGMTNSSEWRFAVLVGDPSNLHAHGLGETIPLSEVVDPHSCHALVDAGLDPRLAQGLFIAVFPSFLCDLEPAGGVEPVDFLDGESQILQDAGRVLTKQGRR